MNRILRNDVYKHYKGNYYRIISIAKHSEREEELVIYQSLYKGLERWARPKEMFIGKVDNKPRFEYVGNLDDQNIFLSEPHSRQ